MFFLIGGELKSSTEAVVRESGHQNAFDVSFYKGLERTRSQKREGFTTPDTNEALVKEKAVRQCRDAYVLADCSKFGQVSSVTFEEFAHMHILTEKIPEEYQECGNVLKVE